MDVRRIAVEEFTTPSPTSVLMDTPLPEVWEVMQEQGIRHVLVHNTDNQIVGILSQRDLTTFSQAQDFANIEAQDVMSRNIVTVPPDTPLYEVALKMSEEKIGSTVVHDEDSDFMGIFTATDALNALVEVLRGDIDEEEQLQAL